MIFQYDPIKIGQKLREVRESRKLTRMMISERSSVSMECIRKIEKGLVLPQLQTLIDLSNYYNLDLFLLISSTLRQCTYNRAYNLNDRLLHQPNCKYTDKPEENNVLVDQEEVKRLETYKSLLRNYNLRQNYSPDNAIKGIHKLIVDKHPLFNIYDISKLVLNNLDMKIIVSYASLLGDLSDYKSSQLLLNQLKDIVSNLNNEDLSVAKLNIKIECLRAYNLHSTNQNACVIDLCTSALHYCQEREINYYVYYLYYRRAISYYIMHDNRYVDDLETISYVLKSVKDYDTLNYLIKVTHEKYGLAWS